MTPSLTSSSRPATPVSAPPGPPPAARRLVGTCVPDGRAWTWDGDAARLHGLELGAVRPTDALLLAHCDRDDRAALAALLSGDGPRAVRYRLVAADGSERPVLAVAAPTAAPRSPGPTPAPSPSSTTSAGDGDAAGRPGTARPTVLLVDLTPDVTDLAATRADVMLAEAIASREVIDQAKGAVMLAYGLDDAEAFELLRWHSEHLNLKVRALAARLVEQLTSRRRGGTGPRDMVDSALARTAETEGAVTTRTSPPGRTPPSSSHPTTAALHVTHTVAHRQVVARVDGEVDAATIPVLVSGLHLALRATPPDGTLVVDLTAVRRLGPLAALHLGRLRRRCERAEVALRLLPPAARAVPVAPPASTVPSAPGAPSAPVALGASGASRADRAAGAGPAHNVLCQDQPTTRNAR